ARSSALRTASSQLCGEAPITCVMRATAIVRSFLQHEGDLHLDPILANEPTIDLDGLAQDLETRDAPDRHRGALDSALYRLAESLGGRCDDLRDARDRHGPGATTPSREWIVVTRAGRVRPAPSVQRRRHAAGLSREPPPSDASRLGVRARR